MATENSFFRRFAAREPKPIADDPADMGTVFGLEASLGEFNADAHVGAAGDPAPEQAPMDWLTQRHKPRR